MLLLGIKKSREAGNFEFNLKPKETCDLLLKCYVNILNIVCCRKVVKIMS